MHDRHERLWEAKKKGRMGKRKDFVMICLSFDAFEIFKVVYKIKPIGHKGHSSMNFHFVFTAYKRILEYHCLDV